METESSIKVGDFGPEGSEISVEPSSLPPDLSMKEKASGRKSTMMLEVALLCVVMLVIWASLALPVIVFYLPVEGGSVPATPMEPSLCTNSSCQDRLVALNSTGSGFADIEQQATENMFGNSSSSLVCNEAADFFLSEVTGGCAPRCPDWSQHSHRLSKLVDKVVLVCACIGAISAVIVLAIACIRYKYMFSFPSIFVVYLTVSLLVLVVFFVINFIDRGHLYCTSHDLRFALLDPTDFCIVAGSVFYYCLIQITLWWFFHISALFWAFRFPVHFRSYVQLHRIRYIHAACVLLGLVIPVLPVVVTLGDYATDEKTSSTPTGFGFGLTNFPPVLCAGLDPDASFYSLVLPITVLTEIGMTLLVFTFWDVRKNHAHSIHIAIKQKKGCFKIGSGEKKILIVLLYYALLVEFSLMAFTLGARNLTQFRTAVVTNFVCESQGYNPEAPCDRSQLESLKYPGINVLAYSLLLLFPVINFTYVIKFRVLKKWLCRCMFNKKREVSSNLMYMYSNSSATCSVNLQRFKLETDVNSVCSVVPEAMLVNESV